MMLTLKYLNSAFLFAADGEKRRRSEKNIIYFNLTH